MKTAIPQVCGTTQRCPIATMAIAARVMPATLPRNDGNISGRQFDRSRRPKTTPPRMQMPRTTRTRRTRSSRVGRWRPSSRPIVPVPDMRWVRRTTPMPPPGSTSRARFPRGRPLLSPRAMSRVRAIDPSRLPKHFDAAAAEARWHEAWDRLAVHAYDPDRSRAETFVVDTPPPTVSGSLHVGHVFSYTQTDVLARYQRM